MGIASFS
jgi:Asp-tRNA(Asn)/Glu-tRNA(Gln) amidotransferase A subunit family amidase